MNQPTVSTELAAPADSRWKPGQSGNPSGRPKRIGVVRDLLENEQEALVRKAINLALEGDVSALRLCIERLAPPLRPTTEPVSIPALADAKTLTEKCAAIVDAVASGAISPTVGGELLTAISSLAKAIEVDLLESRLAALEQRMRQ